MSEETPQKTAIQKAVKMRDGRVVRETLHDQLVVADMMRKSGILPAYIKTQAQAWVLLQAGAENGLEPITTTRWLYVQPKTNKVEWTAEGALGVALRSGLIEEHDEGLDTSHKDENEHFGWFLIKRRDQRKAHIVKITVRQAKKWGVWHSKTRNGNDSAWVTFDEEMLIATAKRRCVRLAVPEALGGLSIKGELQQERDVQRGEVAEERSENPDIVDAEVVQKEPVSDPLLDALKGKNGAPSSPEVAEAQEIDERDAAEAFQGLIEEAGLRTGDDEEARAELEADLSRVYQAKGIAAAQAYLAQHEVFGDPHPEHVKVAKEQSGLFK